MFPTMIYNQAFFSMVLFSTAMNAEVSAGNKDQGLLDESGHRRFKTYPRWTHDGCVEKCISASPFPAPVWEFFLEVFREVFVLENTTNIRRFFNVTILKWHCEYGSQRQQCVYKCSNESANRQEILEILRPTSYICNESDFIRNTECYREVYDQDLDDCESRDKCLPYKTAVKNQRLEDLREWPSVLGSICEYIICGNQCRSKEIISRCGRESNEILLNFYSRVVASIKKFLIFFFHDYSGEELTFTDTCDQI